MFTLYGVILDTLFFLLNKAFDYLTNSDFTTYCSYNTLKLYTGCPKSNRTQILIKIRYQNQQTS